jgi:hypothetical protein
MTVSAVSADDAVSQIKKTAEADGYRFIQVGADGLTEDIRNDLAENDKMYVDDSPIGSVKVIVLDSDTGKPVKDASCFLTFYTSRYTVNSDGSHTQTANPFLLFDLGKTPVAGEIAFKDTYFYSTTKVEPGQEPFVETVSVSLATPVDKDPEIAIDYNAQPFFSSSSDPSLFDAIVAKLGGQAVIKFSELKAIVQEVAGDKYTEYIRSLFNYEFAIFSDNVTVKVSNAPQFEKLGKQQLTIGELRTYIDSNKDLFIKYVANRYYPDFGGFEPCFTFDYNPEYDYVKTYKDGTQKNETNAAYLGMYIFDSSVCKGGTGYALDTDGFSYRAYVYADGYKDGKAIGAAISQDHVDKDVIFKIYLSKDVSPMVARDGANALFGTLFGPDKKPISDAEIRIKDTEYKAVTNADGYFSFTNLKLEGKTAALTVINPENGEPLPVTIVFEGKKYDTDTIPVDLSGENGVFKMTLVNGDASDYLTGGSGPSIVTLLLIVAVVVVAALVVVLVVVLSRKNRKPPAISVQYAGNPGKPPSTAPISDPRFCSACGSQLKPDAVFCANCGTHVK